MKAISRTKGNIMKPQYVIAQDNSAGMLCDSVNQLLEQGYVLVGGLCVSNEVSEGGVTMERFYQAAIRMPKVLSINPSAIGVRG